MVKNLEFKLQLYKKRYEDELNSSSEAKIETIFTNSGAKEYLDKLKARDKINSDMITNLKAELEMSKRELALVRARCQKAEEQNEYHKHQWREAQARSWQLEAEKKAYADRERQFLERSINRSYASSYIDNNQPPPPNLNDVPSIEEILNSPDASCYFNFPADNRSINMS